MAYEPRNNTGTLFINDKKTSDKSPDWRGDALVDGVKKRMSVWRKTGARGEFLSVAFDDPKPYQAAEPKAAAATPAPQPSHAPLDDDSIPFSPGFSPCCV